MQIKHVPSDDGEHVELTGTSVDDPFGESTITGSCVENKPCTLTQIYSSGSLAGKTYFYYGKTSFRKWMLLGISGKYALQGEKSSGTFSLQR